MAKKSHFLKGVVIGGVIGAAAALLAAPKKGAELREDALNKYNDFKDDPQGALSDLRDFSVDKFNEVKEKFDTGEYSAEKAKDFLLEKRDFIREKVESGELSPEMVKDFFTQTKASLAERFSADRKAADMDLDVEYSWTDSETDEKDW